MMRLKNSGQAIVQVLIAAGLLAGISAAIMTYINNSNKELNLYSNTQDTELFAKAIQNIVSDSNSCYGTVAGAPRTDINSTPNPTTDMEGLMFVSVGGGAPTRIAFDPNTDNQQATLGSNFKAGTNNIRIQNGQSFSDFNLTVANFYLANKTLLFENTSEAKYKADLLLQVQPTSAVQPLAPRIVSTLTLSFSKILNPGSLTFVGCVGELSAQTLCQQIGCNYNPAATNQKCLCGYADMTCPAGQYVSGYNPANNTPNCKTIELNCLTAKGPGYFFAGIDTYGFPICVALENPQPGIDCAGAWGSCSAGSETYTIATPASGGGAACPFTNGATRSCGINVTCGSSHGQTLSSAPGSNLCTNGSLSGSVNGTGPWTWDCAGVGGPVNCSANSSAAEYPGACGDGSDMYVKGINCMAGEETMGGCATGQRAILKNRTLSCPMNPFSYSGEMLIRCDDDPSCVASPPLCNGNPKPGAPGGPTGCSAPFTRKCEPAFWECTGAGWEWHGPVCIDPSTDCP